MSDGPQNVSMTRRGFLGAVGAAAVVAASSSMRTAAAAAAGEVAPGEPNLLGGPWQMQSSTVATGTGEQLSQPGGAAGAWYAVTVPCTVLAGLVANGEYPDIYHGDNLKAVPKARFKPSWWYRKEFTAPPGTGVEGGKQQTWLYFKGINYRANIFLNGEKIADGKTAVGAYRDLELNISGGMKSGTNVLAVEVFAPEKNDLSITFVDWAPAPPDGNMGLWQDVELRTSGPVAVRFPHVLTDLEEGLQRARLTVMADVVNATDQAATVTLSGEIGQVKFSQPVTLAAHETRTVTFTPEAFAQLIVDQPRVWWPYHLGKPEMYALSLTASVDGSPSDHASLHFGIRKVTSRLENGHLLFSVNGTDMLILGGGYAPDLLQRRRLPDRPSWQEDHMRYVRGMNLNTVRLEGKLEDDAFYELCDRNGIMVMAGWCCCSEWERWKNWKEEQTSVAMASARYQIRRARTHPSLIAFLNGSDNAPPAAIEKQYLTIEAELHWPNPTISSAANKKAASGPSGVKMEGPYKWEPPIYWLTDKTKGGAYGFNTEVGPGAVPPPAESIRKMLDPKDYWPMDDAWDYHAGGGTFGKFADFTDALDARFGKSKSLADFAWKSQAQAYETIRAMFEGFRRNKFNATGEIQWMLNNAWPSMIWHLYDYYFRAGAAYFATRLACEPLHILYSYDNQSIVVANDTLRAYDGLVATAEVYDIDARQRHTQSATLNSAAGTSTVAFTLPAVAGISTAYFVRLTLKEGAATRCVNSYFLSTKPDVLNEHADNKDDWAFTPCSSYADYTQLEGLAPVKLALENFAVAHDGEEDEASVRVTNASPGIAMMVHLKLTKGKGGEEVLPICWEDNYFMLLPNESRRISARYLAADAAGKEPAIVADCFNNARA